MKKIILIIIIFSAMHPKCIAQKEIIYNFESSVSDSLQNGINMYAKLLNKAKKELKLYVVVMENNNEFEIFLQEYSHLPKSGLLELIRSTNRKLEINEEFTIPIVIPADKMSKQVKKDKIAAIPLSGYYIKVVYENYIQKVVKTSIIF
jgi:hypothetical protein